VLGGGRVQREIGRKLMRMAEGTTSPATDVGVAKGGEEKRKPTPIGIKNLTGSWNTLPISIERG